MAANGVTTCGYCIHLCPNDAVPFAGTHGYRCLKTGRIRVPGASVPEECFVPMAERGNGYKHLKKAVK